MEADCADITQYTCRLAQHKINDHGRQPYLIAFRMGLVALIMHE